VMLTGKPNPAYEPDPVVATFLTLLEADMTKHPGRLRPITAEWLHQLQDVVADVEVDLGAPLPTERD